MGFFDKLQKSQGGYIFLSHSHKDIEKVRQIRDSLEHDGFEPLCFFLKCLDDDSEIEDLIMREIDAREWFIFVDSENSRNSKWVNKERAYIRRTNRKKILTVNLNDWQAVDRALHKISHNLRVFICASNQDGALAQRIKTKLEQRDYLVFFQAESFSQGSGASYATVVQSELIQASQEGGVLLLVTPSMMNSVFVERELSFAIQQGGNIIPIIVGNHALTPGFEYVLSDVRKYHLPENPTDEMIEAMIDRLGYRIIEK